ncbi:hypothetical protein [Rhodanobacter sp. B05]|uniref:hypothetical protein n=1 Tax=Rhodanobacter sp. B05 TaxID=1945859 RepID=UPI0011154984|nr:hypothetical protein [Rhodanobacter sp. B05]
MNALAELRKRAHIAANPANPANQGIRRLANSQDSQTVKAKNHFSLSAALAPLADTRESLRAQLLTLATVGNIGAKHVHRLQDADLTGCIGLDARQLAVYLQMLADTADRHAGRVPAGDTATIYCQRCGLVCVHPDIAKVLPVVDGWPRALGCPWCSVRKAGGSIPRPGHAMSHRAQTDA